MKVELIGSVFLPEFPSGSSVNFYEDKLYVIGDDAQDILVLDRDYQQLGTIHLFDYKEKRIPKPVKADFETSTIVSLEGKDYLLVLGSGSRANRAKGILVELRRERSSHPILAVDYQPFVSRLEAAGLGEINIEGSTVIGNQLMLSNRANRNSPVNRLITTAVDFWTDQQNARISVSTLRLTMKQEEIIGVSELYFLRSHDRLLMTLSTELTDNSYEDGAIGDSYLGWINDLSNKLNDAVIELDGFINLSVSNTIFKGEKIEGLCVESTLKNTAVIHLVSDDDKGHSKLFKIRLSS